MSIDFKIENWVDEHGDYLLNYALVRVGKNRPLAEDLVQETFLSVIKTSARPKGNSAIRTWLISILRNKIIDHYRSRKNKLLTQSAFSDEQFVESGPQKGQWKPELAPADWQIDPDKTLEQKEFTMVLQGCISSLPEHLATVFSLRELDGMDSKAICKELGITTSNLWVMLHRARSGLRRCLEKNWFI